VAHATVVSRLKGAANPYSRIVGQRTSAYLRGATSAGLTPLAGGGTFFTAAGRPVIVLMDEGNMNNISA